MTSRTYVDIHVLQTVPPSNLNRDDACSPQHAIYGGIRRARVSSQAWKRAARQEFAETVPADQFATRTRKLPALISDRLRARGVEQARPERIATHALKAMKISYDDKARQSRSRSR